MSAHQSAIAALGRTGPILNDAPEASRAAKRNVAASPKTAPPEAQKPLDSKRVDSKHVDSKRVDSKRVDRWMLGGILITVSALAAGIAATRVPLSYFFQPSGVLIVIGGTLGATVVTTPKRALQQAARRVLGLLWEHDVSRARLVEEIMSYIRVARTKGLLGIEPMIRGCRHELLRDSLTLALDVQKEELQTAIETKMRLRERRGEEDARTLETAGGFAPTIGVMGTVVGLIDVLRRLSDLTAVAGGVGTAFASTLYGIGLANLLLLPLAHRIRAAVAANFETEELILEGVVCLFDCVHPALAEERLKSFLDQKQNA